MRIIGSIVTALMILGLAAFSVVTGQQLNGGSPPAMAFNPNAAPAPTAARRHPVNPVSQVAQIGAETAPMANAPANAAPVRLARATQNSGRFKWLGTECVGAAEARAGSHRHSSLQQARRHGTFAHRGDRHYQRPRLRFRTFQAI